MKKIIYNLVVVVIFAVVYSIYISTTNDYWFIKNDEETNVLVDGLYTSAVVHTTMGFGGFPKKIIGQLLIILQLILMFFGNLYLFSK